MTEWKTYKLSEVAIISTGFPFAGEKYAKEGIRVVRGDNVTIGALRWDNDKLKCWNEPFARANEFSLMNGDIVVGMDGSRVGLNRAQVKKTDLPLLLAQRVACIRHNEKTTQDFLYYQIFSERFVKYIKQVQTGTSIPHVSLKQIGGFEVSLPSLEEQRRIAGILGAIDDKIENNRRINTNLELQAQALFDKIFFDDKDAERNPLSDYANINPTRALRQGVVARYIEMANLPTKGSFPSDWSYKSYGGGCKFANGDTIMARITPCLENGKTAYIDFLEEQEVAFGSTEYIVISAKSGYCPALFYFLARNKEFVDYAVGHMNGSSGRQRVGGVDIANFPMPHITLEDSNKFAEIAMPIMDVIRNNSLENRQLANLRDTLLPKLMNGEIKVTE